MNNFKSGQLCTIVKDAYNSSLSDIDVTHNGVYAKSWNKNETHIIPEGTPVLILEPYELYCKILIWDEIFLIKNNGLEML